MKIAVLTVHRAFNMGALLQAWALKNTLERMGHTVEFPECNTVGMLHHRFLRPRAYAGALARLVFKANANVLRFVLSEDWAAWQHRTFVKKRLNSVPCRLEDLSRYDLIVVGSDQVWNEAIMELDSGLFLGETVPSSVPLVGYAVSMGDEVTASTHPERIAAAVRRFAALTVREGFAQRYITSLGFPPPPLVLDPSLLLTQAEYAALEALRLVDEEYLFVYNIGGGDLRPVAEGVAKRIGVRRIVLMKGTLGWSPTLPPHQSWGDTPARFLSYVHHAKAVLACSFHGTAFSVIYQKPFVALSYAKRENLGETRQAKLLEAVGLRDWLLHVSDPVETIAEKMYNALDIEGAVAVQQLEQLRGESMDRLKGLLAYGR